MERSKRRDEKQRKQEGIPLALNWAGCGLVLLAFAQLFKWRTSGFDGFYPVLVAFGCLMIAIGAVIWWRSRKR